MKKFKDFNFKLMVIQELMYNREVLDPIFDLDEFAENYTERNIDTYTISYEIIPEVKKHFEDLDIPEDLLDSITELNADGGDDIYFQLCPHWDGEDDLFNVKSADDCSGLKKLKKVTIFYDDDVSILEKFAQFGVKAEWV